MAGDGSFARAFVLVTAFKRLSTGRTRAVRGFFRNVQPADLEFRHDDGASPVRGCLDIDLESLMTDAPERDTNVVTHLFGAMRNVRATIDPAGQILTSEGEDSFGFRGFVDVSIGMRVPIVLAIRRRRLGERTEVSARLARPIDLSITGLGLPFAAFAHATGVSTLVDRVELDVGVVFDERAVKARTRVVIAGAGIAGLAAAQTLIDAGCDVTVLEKERFCGGKLTSHVDDALGHTVEHGIHGVFPPYKNLVALWREAGIGESIFADTTTVGVPSPSGMTSGKFRTLSGRAPLFLREMIPVGLLRARDFAASAAFLARVYGAASDRDMLDRETFQALLDRYGVSERVQRFVMHPYVKNLSYARPDQISAAAACDALGYYLLENVDNFKARWLDGGPQELVIDPWVTELSKRGVRFLTGTPVKFVLFENGRFQGFATRAVIPGRRLGTHDRCWVQRFGTRVVALRWQPDRQELKAWDGLCTHAGCPLQPAGENGCNGFRCDCHGGAFDLEGQVLRAPPKQPLVSLPVAREEVSGETFWKVSLDGSDDGDGVLSADYGIVALDIEGARRVLTPALLDLPSTRGIATLRTTPLMVLRMWFRGKDYDGPDSGFLQAGDLLDNFFVLDRFQREFREIEGYTVVECHIGDCSSIEGRDDDDVVLEAARCLERYFPALGPASVDLGKSRVLRHREGFSLFSPGDAARTPTVAASDRPNLLFAGDWVRSETRSWYMERAAVTGIEAANNVLAREAAPLRHVATATSEDVVPKLIGLPFRASGALGRAYRAVLDGEEEAPVTEPSPRGSAPDISVKDAPRFAPPLVDLAELLSKSELARVHPSVRSFYADPSEFEAVVRFHVGPLVERVARRGLPFSPLYALGLVGARAGQQRREYPLVMRVYRDARGRPRWDRLLSIDGTEVPLFAGEVSVKSGRMQEALDGHGLAVTVQFEPRVVGRGLRFEMVKASPAWLFATVGLAYETRPTVDGIRTVGTYKHGLLRLDGEIEFEARRRQRQRPVPAPIVDHVFPPAADSAVRLRPSMPPSDLDIPTPKVVGGKAT